MVSNQNMLHPQPPFLRYTSTSSMCYITKTCMVTVCYRASLMKQNFEQKITIFPKFLMKVVDVTWSQKYVLILFALKCK